jgi:hypothetical protein
MNELSVTEQESILALLRLGWSVRRVARETGRRHETIRRYGQQAGVLPPKASQPVAPTAIAVTTSSPAEPQTTAVDLPVKPRIVATEVPAGSAATPHTSATEVPTDLASKPHTSATEVPTDLASKPYTPATEVPTDFGARNSGHNIAPVLRSRSSCSEHAPFIEAELAKGRNATAIYQDLVEHHAYDGSYDAVKRFAPTSPAILAKNAQRSKTVKVSAALA